MDRNEIADELLRGVPPESLDDHQEIAAAIRRGDSREQILAMDATDRWPNTYAWIADHIDI